MAIASRLDQSVTSWIGRDVDSVFIRWQPSKKRAQPLLAFFLGSLLIVSVAGAQMTKNEQSPWVGGSQEPPLALAHDLSPSLRKHDVAHAMERVADWQMKQAQPGFNQDWTFATLYIGFMAVPDDANGRKYRAAMLEMGRKFAWQPGSRLEHADDVAIGQTYLELSRVYHDPAMVAPTRERIDAVMKLPDHPEKPIWWWCDALFMAPALLAELSRDTGDKRYLDYMDREWWTTSKLLYSPQDRLFYRDSTFFTSREGNGQRVFWSRGNGWVFAGLARVLSEMPPDYPSRPRYIAQFQALASRIASLQGTDGLWRAGLLDEAAYKLPETSGSSFFTYGFAYGINAGILDRAKYQPVVEKAWSGLLGRVYEDGRLGSMQPVGAAPGAFGPTSSYVFGTGAFLLAGSEVYRLSR